MTPPISTPTGSPTAGDSTGSSQPKTVAWLIHTGGAIIASGAIFGIIDAFVPAGYKAQAYSLIPVIAYLTGVVMPTPKGDSK